MLIDLAKIKMPGYILDTKAQQIIGKTGKILNKRIDEYGYYTVNVETKNLSHTQRFHRIVALACVNNPKPKEFELVMHKDDNKLNCNPSNLEWGTKALNNYRHNSNSIKYIPKYGKGQNNHAVRKDKDIIISMIKFGMSNGEIQRTISIGWNTINRYRKELASMKCND